MLIRADGNLTPCVAAYCSSVCHNDGLAMSQQYNSSVLSLTHLGQVDNSNICTCREDNPVGSMGGIE